MSAQSLNVSQILSELANLNPPQTKFNTQQIQRALSLVGDPQLSAVVIHIAGSNGKGSIAAFIAEALIAAGYQVGKFTSPYLECLNECIVINQGKIKDKELIDLYLEHKPLLHAENIFLSAFEMLTFLMFVYFSRHKIDYLVLEAGLGGRDDASNVVQSAYSVISNISLEHTQWLGNSLAEIATHKAGIIKSGKTIIADSQVELLNAVKQYTLNFTNVLTKYTYSSRLDSRSFTTWLSFSALGSAQLKLVELGLFGHFQARNFLAAYDVLISIGLADKLIFAAARNTRWPGRLQLIQSYPRVILDAAHNPDGCKNLYASLAEISQAKQVVIICSILRDKDQLAMLKWYSKIGSRIIFCSLNQQSRATPPRETAKLARGMFSQIYVANAAELALRMAKRLKPRLILISGSSYLLAEFIANSHSLA